MVDVDDEVSIEDGSISSIFRPIAEAEERLAIKLDGVRSHREAGHQLCRNCGDQSSNV